MLLLLNPVSGQHLESTVDMSGSLDPEEVIADLLLNVNIFIRV